MVDSIFEIAVSKVAKALNALGRPPILVGGWAVNLYGVVRQTIDFDMMIFEDDFSMVEEVFHGTTYELLVQTSLYARFESKTATLALIDTLFANQRTYGILSDSSRNTTVCGETFLLPKPEHIIAMKLHAVKHGEKIRGGKDFQDIIDLIAANKLDRRSSDFKELCVKYGNDKIYGRILNDSTLDRS
jgi:hypothetical protein